MPRKKKETTTFSVTQTTRNGFKQDTQLRVLAFFFWDEKLETYTLYGLSQCSLSYQKMVKAICYSFTESEEIELRLQACSEVLCADVYFRNGRFIRCDVRMDKLPDGMLEKLRSNVDQVILNERKQSLMQQEREEQIEAADLDDLDDV